jgi:hypothetical protein
MQHGEDQGGSTHRHHCLGYRVSRKASKAVPRIKICARWKVAYFILAASALGLDCGPMSRFDIAKVDAEFFPDGKWKTNFLCNVGYGDAAKLFPATRSCRLKRPAWSCEPDSAERQALNGGEQQRANRAMTSRVNLDMASAACRLASPTLDDQWATCIASNFTLPMPIKAQ